MNEVHKNRCYFPTAPQTTFGNGKRGKGKGKGSSKGKGAKGNGAKASAKATKVNIRQDLAFVR